jgi:hypothetical protein
VTFRFHPQNEAFFGVVGVTFTLQSLEILATLCL